MREIFFDTWAWIALANKKDEHHREAVKFFKEILLAKGRAVTTDYVLAETFSALRKMAPMEAGIHFGRMLLENMKSGRFRLEFIDEMRFVKTWELHEKFKDKPQISFFDLSSIAVMEELGLKEIFTGDRDFERVGLGFTLWPQ